MAGIFTRPELTKIINNADLTPEERVDQIFALYGRAVDDGFITRKAAEAAQNAAVETAKAEWEKNLPKVNVLETEEYKKLQSDFDGYKTRQTVLGSEDFKDVKPKFRDKVYDALETGEGAKPISEQLAAIRKDYEEYFTAAEPAPNKPQFGAPPQGSMPKGEEGAVAAIANAWGFPKK